MPGGFMVFTDKSETTSHRADTVYNCFAHVGSAKTTPVEKKISLLGVCADTTPYSKSKHSRVGVSVSGALPIVMNRDDIKGLFPGDLIDYRFEMTPLQFAGLPPDFRTARVKKRGAYVGPFMAHHSISDLREMLDSSTNKREIAEAVLSEVLPGRSMADLYSYLHRRQPKSDNSIDWIRDMLGAGIFGPSNFDHWWSLHKVVTDDKSGNPKVIMRTKPAPYYMGWLADACTQTRTSPSRPPTQTESNEVFWAKQLELSKKVDQGTLHLVPIGVNAGTVSGDQVTMIRTVLGVANENNPEVNDLMASMLESVLCDGRCGHLGKIVSISDGDEALVLLENPV